MRVPTAVSFGRLRSDFVVALRQHVLERLKRPLLLVVVGVLWAMATFENPLGTSSLFWVAHDGAYILTCITLGLFASAWAWISLLVDTGKPWLTRPEPFFLARWLRWKRLRNWSYLPDLAPVTVFRYIALSTGLVTVAFATAHLLHSAEVTLPERYPGAFSAFVHTLLWSALGGILGIGFLWLLERARHVPAIARRLRRVRLDVLRTARRDEERPKDPKQHAWMHEVAALSTGVAAVVILLLSLASWTLDVQVGPVGPYLCLLGVILSLVLGYADYRRRTGRAWIGLILVGITLLIPSVFASPPYPIRGFDPDGTTIDEALQKAITRIRERPTPTPPTVEEPVRPPLVVLAVSGGGIRAQVWTLGALAALEGALGEQFLRQTRLITGASGGMVGAAHLVGALPPPSDGTLPEDFFEVLLAEASADALTANFRTLVLNDLLGAVPRRLGWDLLDRGRKLEDEWVRHTGGPDQSPFAGLLRDLRDHEQTLATAAPPSAAQWRPVLVFTPTIAEEGRRLVVCNQRVDDLVSNRATVVGPDGKTETVLSVDAVQALDLDPDHEMTLATAARLSANFPGVVASPMLAAPRTGERSLHVIDGGYYDNYGVDLAGRWLLEHHAQIRQQYSGVLFIQICADPRHRLDSRGVASSLPEASYIDVGFQKTTFFTDRQVAQLHTLLNGGTADGEPGDFFAFCSLEFDGPVSLNWSLTASEFYALLQPFVRGPGGALNPDRFPSDARKAWQRGEAIYRECVHSDSKARRILGETEDRVQRQLAALQSWWQTHQPK